MDIAAALRDSRRLARLSQAELAERLGTTRAAISRWERGVVDPGTTSFVAALRVCGRRLVLADAPTQGPHDELDADELALLDAQLARTPEERLHAAQQLSRLARSVRRR